MGGGGEKVPGKYFGWWGALGSQPQKIVTYAVSSNAQNPFAGAGHAAVFNTFRRTRGQFLFVVPPFIAAYFLMDWATHRNEFLNSKEGRALYGDAEE